MSVIFRCTLVLALSSNAMACHKNHAQDKSASSPHDVIPDTGLLERKKLAKAHCDNELPSPVACHDLAQLIARGVDIDLAHDNADRVVALHRQACRQGYKPSCTKIGETYSGQVYATGDSAETIYKSKEPWFLYCIEAFSTSPKSSFMFIVGHYEGDIIAMKSVSTLTSIPEDYNSCVLDTFSLAFPPAEASMAHTKLVRWTFNLDKE